MPAGNEIIFHKSGFKIKPVANDIDLMAHRNFLSKRIDESTHKESKNLIIKRLKRFTCKSVKIHIPGSIYQNNDFMRELDYMLRFIKHSSRSFKVVNFNKRKYFIPSQLPEYVRQKSNSIRSIYSQIDIMVTYDKH